VHGTFSREMREACGGIPPVGAMPQRCDAHALSRHDSAILARDLLHMC
jgi:hypothetical protein